MSDTANLAISLENLNDNQVKSEYLNRRHQAPVIINTLPQLNDIQALRLVRLSIEIDYRLAAILAGKVQPHLQITTVGLIADLPVGKLFRIQLLGLTASEQAIPSLVEALYDESEDNDLLEFAADGLVQIGTEAAITTLIDIVNDEDNDFGYYIPQASWVALLALGKINQAEARLEYIRVMLILLKQSEFSDFAAEELIKIANPDVVLEVTEIMKDEENSLEVRQNAAEVLAKIATSDCIIALQDVVSDDAELALSVEGILNRINLPQVETPSPGGQQNQDILVIESQLNSDNESIRVKAVKQLGVIASDIAIEALRQALNDPYFNVRRCAVEELGNIKASSVELELINALDDEHSSVCYAAIKALGNIKSVSAVPQLISILNSNNQSLIRPLIQSLGEIANSQAIAAITTRLSDSDILIRLASALQLAKLGILNDLSDVYQGLRHPDPKIRDEALIILSIAKNPASLTELMGLLTSDLDAGVLNQLLNVIDSIQLSNDFFMLHCNI